MFLCVLYVRNKNYENKSCVILHMYLILTLSEIQRPLVKTNSEYRKINKRDYKAKQMSNNNNHFKKNKKMLNIVKKKLENCVKVFMYIYFHLFYSQFFLKGVI